MSLKNTLASLAVAASLGGCLVTARGHVSAPVPVAYVEVNEEPPPPRTVAVVEARPGFVWIDGRWGWEGGRWAWHDGYYERERPGYIYEQGRWERRGNGHVWVEGNWRAGGGAEVRDHRSGPPPDVRDHRSGPPPDVRDHRNH